MMNHNVCVGWLVGVVIVTGALVIVGCGGDGAGAGDGQQPQATGSVTGTVIHGGTGLALGGIDVSIGNAAATTGSDGSFTLAGVPVGQQVLVITPDPNRDLALPPGSGPITVVVEDGQTTVLDAPIILIDAPDLPPNPPS